MCDPIQGSPSKGFATLHGEQSLSAPHCCSHSFLTCIAPIPRRVVQVPVLAKEDVSPVVVVEGPPEIDVPLHLYGAQRGGSSKVGASCLVLRYDCVAVAGGALVAQCTACRRTAGAPALRTGRWVQGGGRGGDVYLRRLKSAGASAQ